MRKKLLKFPQKCIIIITKWWSVGESSVKFHRKGAESHVDG
jgi:hypothetical protein